MDALGVLKQEHTLVLRRLRNLEDAAKCILTDEMAGQHELTEKLLDDCKTAWQEIFQHIRNEEEALFPTLEEQINDGEGLVRVMRKEHAELVGTMISLLGEIVKEAGTTGTGLDEGFMKRVQDFRSAFSEHISREDKIVFWLAELHLSPSDRRKLSMELAEVSRLASDSQLA